MVLILSLMFINIRGVRQSSRLNEILGAIDLILETTVVLMGFLLAWHPQLLASQWNVAIHTLPISRFMYGSSLAIISFVGLESISQAAQETRRPATIIPRTSMRPEFYRLYLCRRFLDRRLGILPWQQLPIISVTL